MKVVKSAEALKRLALARGSSASVGGVKFNSTSDRVIAERTPKSEPKPAPPEAPKPVATDNAELLGKIVELLARPAPEVRLPDIVMPEIVLPEIKLPAQAEAKTSWVFKVERDVRGLMTQIVATPKP